jgi:hypothetical protein
MPADIVTVDDGAGAENTIPTNATSGLSRPKEVSHQCQNGEQPLKFERLACTALRHEFHEA